MSEIKTKKYQKLQKRQIQQQGKRQKPHSIYFKMLIVPMGKSNLLWNLKATNTWKNQKLQNPEVWPPWWRTIAMAAAAATTPGRERPGASSFRCNGLPDGTC